MSDGDRAGRVRQAIEYAFAATPPPDPRKVCATQHDEGVSDYFAGRPWRGHKVEDLRFHSVALSFLERNAFRYYLPAFLLAILEDRDGADVIVDITWRKFRDRDDFCNLFGASPDQLFDKRERDGLAVFFRYESDVRAADWDRPLYRADYYPAFEDLTRIETETFAILKNLGRTVPPETLLARCLRAKLAKALGITIESAQV